MGRWAVVLAIALVAAGCSGGGSSTTTEVQTTASTAPDDPTAPTSESLAANEGFLTLPTGFADCGATILTSGWPTTTVFNDEITLSCLNDAIASQTASQYVYWGRDQTGGISGLIIRVNTLGVLTVIDYTVDAAGNVESSDQTCAELQSGMGQPPVCATPADSAGGSVETTVPGRSQSDHSRDRGGQSPPSTGDRQAP